MAVYMQVEGVDGSSTQAHHPNWIPIKYCEFPVERPGVNTTPGKVSDRLRSAVDFPDITMRKDADKASPKLMQWMINGQTKKVVIHFCKEKGDNILEITLYNTLITNLRATVNEDQQPEEELKLDFTKIDMKYSTYNSQNKFETAIPVTYDLSTAAGA